MTIRKRIQASKKASPGNYQKRASGNISIGSIMIMDLVRPLKSLLGEIDIRGQHINVEEVAISFWDAFHFLILLC